jgi:cytochrome P450
MAVTTPGPALLNDPTSELMADPYAVYARLRQAGPVHRIAGPDGRPAWIVTRNDDVRQALPWPAPDICSYHLAGRDISPAGRPVRMLSAGPAPPPR